MDAGIAERATEGDEGAGGEPRHAGHKGGNEYASEQPSLLMRLGAGGPAKPGGLGGHAGQRDQDPEEHHEELWVSDEAAAPADARDGNRDPDHQQTGRRSRGADPGWEPPVGEQHHGPQIGPDTT